MTQAELEKLIAVGAEIQVCLVEQVILVGPMDRADELRQVLKEGGFDILSSGPYTDAEMHPRCDTTRYKYHVERQIL